MNEAIIIKQLRKFFATADYDLANVFIWNWESDFFCVTKSGYTIEVEVKISKSDFKADLKKTLKHHIFKNTERDIITIPGYESVNFCHVSFVKPRTPNKFYYCCPENMVNPEDVPEYAGLLYYIQEEKRSEYRDDIWTEHIIKQVKPAKFLHKNKPDYSKILLEKYYYLYLDLKREYTMLTGRIKSMQKQFNPDYDIDIKNKHINEPKYYEPELFEDNLKVEPIKEA